MQKKPRNLLFLFSDQHAQRVSGAYGDKIIKTPNIDRLANEGVKFDNAYCPSPICVPSRMSALTARWPHRQECWSNDDMLRSDIPTWLHAAGAAGYEPTLIGRLHSIGPDQLHGYSRRKVGDHSPNYPGSTRQSMGVLTGTNDPNPESLQQSGAGLSAYQVKDTEATEAAIKWLRNTGAKKNKEGKPFCLTVGLMLPHPPYVADQDAFNIYKNSISSPKLGPDNLPGEFNTWWRSMRQIEDISLEVIKRTRAAYWALVHRLDEMIGEILNALDELDVIDDTVIVYTSDHGDHLGERGLWWKHTFFEESVKIPLIMRLPGVLPAGEVRSQVVNLIDLSQTMLESIGVEQLPNADGKSFWSVAKDNSHPWINETFSEYCTDPLPSWTGGRAVQQRMIRSKNWKLSIYDSEPPLLFDLSSDPLEKKNKAKDPEFQEILQELTRKLTKDWQVKEIAAKMRDKRIEKDLLANWARSSQPDETNIWKFSSEINRLDQIKDS